jgi:hypothetical protein
VVFCLRRVGKSKRPAVGDHIDSRCTRCRVVTNHIIVAMVGEKVVRVQCNTCGGIHNYHAPTPAVTERRSESRSERAPKATPPGGRSKAGKATAERETWLSAVGDVDPARAAEYQMTGSYRVSDPVRHPIFGVGVVTSVASGKMEVLFENGRKLLRCGGK